MADVHSDLQQIHDFLGCATPQVWIDHALQHLDVLLVDHAHCEKKAASTALSMIFRYPQYPDLCQRLSRLAREEMRHFEKVLALMQAMGVEYRHLEPSRYAKGLRQCVAHSEPQRFIDLLIMSAFVEARSCERFAALVPYLEGELQKFYKGLLAAEARHFMIYLEYATELSDVDITPKIAEFRLKEQQLIETNDPDFQFHSGVPEHQSAVA